MAHLVGDHVGLREVARRVETVTKLPVEAEVDVDLPVDRAIEGTHGGLADAAARAHRVGEDHEARRLVAASALREDLAPRVLGGGEHDGDEVGERVPGRAGGRRVCACGSSGIGDLDRCIATVQLPEQRQRVRAEEPGRQQQQDDPAAAELQAAPAETDARTAHVIHVVASAFVFPAHGEAPRGQVPRRPLGQHSGPLVPDRATVDSCRLQEGRRRTRATCKTTSAFFSWPSVRVQARLMLLPGARRSRRANGQGAHGSRPLG